MSTLNADEYLHFAFVWIFAARCQIEQHEADGKPSDKYSDETIHSFSIK